jgi:hypothetical protein
MKSAMASYTNSRAMKEEVAKDKKKYANIVGLS